MKTLAEGKSPDAIYKLLKVTINAHQEMFKSTLEFTDSIGDIADKLETKKQLFATDEQNESFNM